jgi:hypothetical protein
MEAGCQTCLEIFEAAPDDNSFVEYLCSHAPECACEKHQVSRFAPDHVDDDETLVRLIVDDTHIERTGDSVTLKGSVFLNDVASFGASTLRLGRATAAEFQHQIEELLSTGRSKADGTPREVIGFVTLPASIVRSIMTDFDKDRNELKVRALAAYATGLRDVPNHADITLATYSPLSGGGRIRCFKELGKAVAQNFRVASSIDEIIALGV